MLIECPQCNYSLTGLPSEHRCPECGLVYDALCEIYRVTGWWALFRMAALPILVVAWCLGQWRNLVKTLPPHLNWISWIGVTAFLIAVVWIVSRVIRNKHRGLMVVTMPEALWLRLSKLNDERIPWTGISRIVVNRGFVGATMFVKGTKSVHDIQGVFRKRSDVERFVAQATARIAQANTTPAD